MAIVLDLRIAKSLFYVVSRAPLAAPGGRQRERGAVKRDALLWPSRGCPAPAGPARAAQAEAWR